MLLGDARSGKFADNLLGFGRMLRRAGIRVDTARIGLAQQALTHIDIGSRLEVRSALESVLVNRQEDREAFSDLFEAYFKDPEIARQLLAQLLPQTKASANPPRRSPRAQEALLAAVNRPRANPGQSDHQEVRLDAAMSASERERLRHADFEKLSASEFKLVEQLAREIPMALPQVPSRRQVPSDSGSQVHWRSLIRDAARHDGDFIDITWSRRKPAPLPLLVLVDVSGSMERYARLMLAFLHQATRKAPKAVFAFGTQLTDLSAAFALDDTDAMLTILNRRVSDFGGGTLISKALHVLRKQHRQAIVANRTVVLLITDGLDTGNPDDLQREVGWLCRQCRQTLWLNPLLRYHGYEPSASGARVLAKHADQMLAIHNLAHLQTLAAGLVRLLSQARS